MDTKLVISLANPFQFNRHGFDNNNPTCNYDDSKLNTGYIIIMTYCITPFQSQPSVQLYTRAMYSV